jgi:hypothetical protein
MTNQSTRPLPPPDGSAVIQSPRPLPPPDRDATSAMLHPALQGDVDKLSKINAVAAIAAGALVIAIPGVFRWLLQLGGATDLGLRILGAAWVLLGLWFAATAARPRTRLITTISVLLLLANVVLLLAAPFVLGLDVGWIGWLALFFLSLYFTASATAWLLVRNRMAGRVKPRQIEDSASSPAT